MSLSRSDIDKISDTVKLPVFGFVRQIQKIFDSMDAFYIIPELVTFIILSYYHAFDRLDKNFCGYSLQLSDDGMVVNNEKINTVFAYNTVYGALIIDSMLNGTYNWKFQNLGKGTHTLNFGIDNADGNNLVRGAYCNEKKASYMYHAGGGKLYQWNKSITPHNKRIMPFRKQNGILNMTLEFMENRTAGILKFHVDDEKQVVAFKDVLREDGLKYRLAISMGGGARIRIKLLDS